MVYYRKYRPQKIDDLDSASVRETLYAVLQKNIPHAFLFTGPKGLGKTSTARIVAKGVNCELRVENGELRNKKSSNKDNNSQLSTFNSQFLEPCNECDQCIFITNGTNVDVLEIDAASNRGIDEIRELKEKIRLAPVAAKRKVYIIDEVHMLTTEAFNALLKTLEEPPDHAMFILCTTESHKVPDTIVSRCFQIQFKPATEEELVRSFKRIVEGEKLKIDDEALQEIAKMADGGFRDGVKILEELVLIADGKQINKGLVEEKYQVSSIKYQVSSIIEELQKKDVKKSLEIVQKVSNQGVDVKYFIQEFMEALHEMLLVQIGIQDTKYDIPNNRLSLKEIKQLSALISRAYLETKQAVFPQLPLELAVIEWCESELKVEKGELKNEKEIQKREVPDDSEVSVSSLRKKVGTMKKLKAMYGAPTTTVSKGEEVSVETTSVELLHTSGNGPVTKEWIELFWRSLIGEMKKHNHTVAGVLRGCMIKSYENQQLVIQTAYKFHKERLDDIKNHDALMKVSKLLTGKDIQIEIELRNENN